MNQQSLQKVFAVFLVLVGAFVIIREGGKLLDHRSDQPVGLAQPIAHDPQVNWHIESSTHPQE